MQSSRQNHREPYRLCVYLSPQFSLMAFVSATEPLRVANRLNPTPVFEIVLVSERGDAVVSSSGFISAVDFSIDDSPKVDCVLICASFEQQKSITPKLIAWLKRLANQNTTIAGVDTGGYVLAKARLLDGYRATIHWEYLDAMVEEFPRVQTVRELFVVDRKRMTAAGGVACLDMMLNFIREGFGHTLATEVAEQLLYPRIRDSREVQRMPLRERLAVANATVLNAVALMEESLEDPLSTSEVAQRVGVSLRELERLFQRWLKTSPGAYYRSLRLNNAVILLTQSTKSITEVSVACGYASLASFSRAYYTVFGQSPSQTRTNGFIDNIAVL